MAKKMYMAIGLDNEQLEMCEHPKSSPYMQTAHLIFARSLKEATGKARRLLGNPPKVVNQIGIFVAGDIGNQELHHSGLGDKLERISITDNNDTNEGVLIMMQNPKVGKSSITATKAEIRAMNKAFKAMAAKAGK